MADFDSGFWSFAIGIVVLLSIGACVLLAAMQAVNSVESPEQDGAGFDETGESTVGTTGHVWDEDLSELNNPMPKWWLNLFYITCGFGVLYILLFPGLGGFRGALAWSSSNQYAQEVKRVSAEVGPLFAAFSTREIADLATDQNAIAMGERLYLTYCTQCHGSDARGSAGFPNLTDHDWLGAGTPAYIKSTILQGRNGIMPPMADALGGREQDVNAVAHYVMSLSGGDHDPTRAAAGEPGFALCAACHGASGGGNPALGAPNLTDSIWLHGDTVSDIQRVIEQGVNNAMPPFATWLDESRAHVLAAYVVGLQTDEESVQDSDVSE